MKTITITTGKGTGMFVASCDGYELAKSKDPGWSACRKLQEAGFTGPVQITAPNSDTISFRGTVEHFATLTTEEGANRPARFGKYRPHHFKHSA